MKNLYLGQIPSQGKSKQGKIRGAQLLSAPSFFFAMDYQKRAHNMCHKNYKNFKKISAIRKEFWFPKILSHRI